MMFWVKPSDQGVMVGKGKRRIRWDHSIRRARTLPCDFQNVLGSVFFRIVVAEAIEGNHDNIVFLLLFCRIRFVINDDKGNDLLCISRPAEDRDQKPCKYSSTKDGFQRALARSSS